MAEARALLEAGEVFVVVTAEAVEYRFGLYPEYPYPEDEDGEEDTDAEAEEEVLEART